MTTFIKKLMGSACLKYKTNDSAKKDSAKKGIIINKINKNDVNTDGSKKVWLLDNSRNKI